MACDGLRWPAMIERSSWQRLVKGQRSRGVKSSIRSVMAPRQTRTHDGKPKTRVGSRLGVSISIPPTSKQATFETRLVFIPLKPSSPPPLFSGTPFGCNKNDWVPQVPQVQALRVRHVAKHHRVGAKRFGAIILASFSSGTLVKDRERRIVEAVESASIWTRPQIMHVPTRARTCFE